MFSFFGTTEIWLGQNINLPELCGRRRIRGISDPVNTIKQALFYFKFTEHVNHLRSNFQKVLFCLFFFLNHASSTLISRTLKFQTLVRTCEKSSEVNLQVLDKTYLLRIDRCSPHTEFCLASGVPVSSSVTAKQIFSAVSSLSMNKKQS